ncbi:MAG: hypothetical protein V1773_01220 [bacterium]
MKFFLRKIFQFIAIPFLLYAITYFLIPRELYQTSELMFWKNIFGWEHRINVNPSFNKASYNIVIGDSRSQHGLNAKKINAINLSLGGTTPVEGYYLLKEILSTTKIDTVYCSYAAFHIFYQDCFFNRTVYYDIVDDNFIKNVIDKSLELGDPNYIINPHKNLKFTLLNFEYQTMGSLKISRKLKDFYEFIRFGPKNIFDNLLSSNFSDFRFETGYNNFGSQNVISSNKENIITLEWKFNERRLKKSEINQIYLDLLIRLCKSHGIICYFIVVPIPENSIKPNEVFFNKYINVLKNKFTSNKLICNSLFYPNSCFKDESHLNKKGVDRFTNAVKRALNKR